MRLGYELASGMAGIMIGAMAAAAMAGGPSIHTSEGVVWESVPTRGPVIHTRDGVKGEPGPHAATREMKMRGGSVLVNPIVESAATVSRALAEQPVYPHLIEVKLRGGTTIYIDPNEDYVHQGPNPIDANSTIPRAQMLHRHLTAKPQVFRGDGHQPQEAKKEMDESAPVIVIPKPAAPVKPEKPELQKVENAPEQAPSKTEQTQATEAEAEKAESTPAADEKPSRKTKKFKVPWPRPKNPHKNLA